MSRSSTPAMRRRIRSADFAPNRAARPRAGGRGAPVRSAAMGKVLLVNGRRVEPGEPAVAADDPGLYGQGVYESLRTYDGRPFAVSRHLDRLQRGARGLGLE